MDQRARDGFTKALEGHPLNSVETLQQEIDQGFAYVWSGEKSDVFVRIGGGVCEMGPAAGELTEIIGQALPAIEHWAEQNNCTDVMIQAGREGWARALAPHGYELAAVILRKRLRWA